MFNWVNPIMTFKKDHIESLSGYPAQQLHSKRKANCGHCYFIVSKYCDIDTCVFLKILSVLTLICLNGMRHVKLAKAEDSRTTWTYSWARPRSHKDSQTLLPANLQLASTFRNKSQIKIASKAESQRFHVMMIKQIKWTDPYSASFISRVWWIDSTHWQWVQHYHSLWPREDVMPYSTTLRNKKKGVLWSTEPWNVKPWGSEPWRTAKIPLFSDLRRYSCFYWNLVIWKATLVVDYLGRRACDWKYPRFGSI